MNRQPRTEAELYQWHRETVEYIAAHGEADRGRPPLHENEPHCGWYRRRLIAKGPFVPARVWIEPGETDAETGEMVSPERMLCEVDGKRVDVFRAWTWIARYPISEDQYMEMLAGGFRGLADPDPAPAPTREAPRPEESPVPDTAPPATPALGEPLF